MALRLKYTSNGALRGSAPTNCAFGPPDSQRLYVVETEHGAVETLDLDAEGLRLWR